MSNTSYYAELIEVSKDAGPYKLAKVKAFGNEFYVHIAEPQGLQSNPINGSLVLVTKADGDLGKAFGTVLPPPKDRVDAQKEGEATYINHKAGQTMKFDEDGNVTITCSGTTTINAEKLVIKADVEIEGDIEQTGDYSQSGVHTDSNGPHTA